MTEKYLAETTYHIEMTDWASSARLDILDDQRIFMAPGAVAINLIDEEDEDHALEEYVPLEVALYLDETGRAEKYEIFWPEGSPSLDDDMNELQERFLDDFRDADWRHGPADHFSGPVSLNTLENAAARTFQTHIGRCLQTLPDDVVIDLWNKQTQDLYPENRVLPNSIETVSTFYGGDVDGLEEAIQCLGGNDQYSLTEHWVTFPHPDFIPVTSDDPRTLMNFNDLSEFILENPEQLQAHNLNLTQLSKMAVPLEGVQYSLPKVNKASEQTQLQTVRQQRSNLEERLKEVESELAILKAEHEETKNLFGSLIQLSKEDLKTAKAVLQQYQLPVNLLGNVIGECHYHDIDPRTPEGLMFGVGQTCCNKINEEIEKKLGVHDAFELTEWDSLDFTLDMDLAGRRALRSAMKEHPELQLSHTAQLALMEFSDIELRTESQQIHQKQGRGR